MNNTQQAGETAKELEKALKEIAQMSDPGSYEKAVIDMKQIACNALAKLKDSPVMKMVFVSQEYNAKIMRSIYEKYKATGLMQYPERIFKMMNEYAEFVGLPPAPAPDAVEAKVAEKARLYVEDFCKPIYYHSENCHKAALLSYLAGHAEGQKATVDAKSAGVIYDLSSAVEHYINAETFIHQLDKDEIDMATDCFKAGWIRRERIATPTSHAEGEKGAVGFADKVKALFEDFPTNTPLYLDSGLWQLRSDDMEEVLVHQGVKESMLEFLERCNSFGIHYHHK